MKIHVTQDDIDNGIPCSILHCALARALTRAFGKPMVMVAIDCHEDGQLTRYPLPPAAIEWRRDFDSHRPVSPMSFELEIPQ